MYAKRGTRPMRDKVMMYLLFVFGAILFENAQLQDGQRIKWTLVLTSQTAETTLLWLLADDQPVGSVALREKVSAKIKDVDNVTWPRRCNGIGDDEVSRMLP